MGAKLERIEKNVVMLEIEVDSEKFEEGLQKSYFKNVKKYSVPGFRKGKVPRKIVERYYGEQVLYEDAINIICPEAYESAVEEHGLQPVDRPEIDIKQIGSGKPMVFTAKVTVKPEVDLGEYKGVEVKKTDVVITDEDVERELNAIAERNARMIAVEDRGVQSGDTVTIDFQGFIDSQSFEGGTGTGYELHIGSGTFIPGFEDQLIGAKTGDEVDVNVTFPEDYSVSQLAGKPALFKTKIKAIKVKELPAVDDEFAKDVSEFETLAEFREDIRKRLTEAAQNEAERRLEQDVIEQVVNRASVDIPPVMIEKQIDSHIFDLEMNLQYQGLSLQRYLQLVNTDLETLRKQFAERAEAEVKTMLVLEKISKVEDIVCSDEELEEEIRKMAERYKQDEQEIKKHLSQDDIEYIKRRVIRDKTVKLLVQSAKIT